MFKGLYVYCMYEKSSNYTAKTFAVCKNVIKQVVKVETVQYQQLYRLQTARQNAKGGA